MSAAADFEYKLLEPDRAHLDQFVRAMFKRATAGNFVSLRAFVDNGDRDAPPLRISPILLTDRYLDFLIDSAEDDARRAANDPKKVVFSPPVCTFTKRDSAKEVDVAQGLAISVECDQKPAEARQKLEELLGPATLVVASGGQWTDPATGELHAKLHLHWRLSAPAKGKEDLPLLKEARKLATSLVDADPSAVPICHPFRWPGSWHRKGDPVLCAIETANPDNEIDLRQASVILKKAAAAKASEPGNDQSKASFGDQQQWKRPNDTVELMDQIRSGAAYHHPLVSLSARLIGSKMSERATIAFLKDLMHASVGPRDDRWTNRFSSIEGLVESAGKKYGKGSGDEGAGHSDEGGRPEMADPVDLWGKFDPPSLTHGMLPEEIERFAFDQGTDMGGDMAGLAVSALAVCAAAIPDRIQLQVKEHNRGWLESARMWVALVGPVSAMKSPIVNAAVKPLLHIDSEMARQYSEARAVYDRLPPDERRQKNPPKQTRVMLRDVTIEAAQEIFKDSPDGVLSFQDELGGWFGSMDKYSGARGSAKDRAFWLEAYNGGPYSVSRISRGTFHIDNLSTSVLGGIQPDAIRKLAGDCVDDGLLQRIIPIILQPAHAGRDEPLADSVEDYAELINHLHRLEPPRGSLGIAAALRFDRGAQAIRQRLEAKHLELQQLEVINRKLAAHIGKYNGIFARLCVVWHCIAHAGVEYAGALPPVVSERTASQVETFLHRFLLPHAISFYAGTLGLSDQHERLAAVAGYILAHKLERITNRDIQRGDRAMRRLERRDTESVFDQLNALGWIDRTRPSRPTDPAHWTVNPAVHIKFADRAAAEKERRDRTQKTIAGVYGAGWAA